MTDKKAEIKEKEKISKHKFFFELPLYSSVKFDDLEEEFEDFFEEDVDGYSPFGEETTFNISRRPIYHSYADLSNYSVVVLKCKRRGFVQLTFFIYHNGDEVQKVGQLPSAADLQYADIGKKYDKVLSKQDLHDLKKAIGLMAHGAGAGSLVYLRRIFENIIWTTYKSHEKTLEISDAEFLKKRMDEKVDFLKGQLPSQLVEMKIIYGILSKGVHELNEDECLAYFPALKLSITLILDQKIEEKAKRKKESMVKEAIVEIAKKVNGRNNS